MVPNAASTGHCVGTLSKSFALSCSVYLLFWHMVLNFGRRVTHKIHIEHLYSASSRKLLRGCIVYRCFDSIFHAHCTPTWQHYQLVLSCRNTGYNEPQTLNQKIFLKLSLVNSQL